MSNLVIKPMNVPTVIFELSLSYRLPSGQVKMPRPFLLSSFHCPIICPEMIISQDASCVAQNHKCHEHDF